MTPFAVPVREIPGGVAIDADAVLLALAAQQPRWAETLRTLARSEDLVGVELAIGLPLGSAVPES